MTLMQTPPRDRSPVLTFVEPWDDGLIEEGITRELDRGGQVFFVHNRVETIDAMAERIRHARAAGADRRRSRPDARARSRGSDARVRRWRDRRARFDDDRRIGARRSEREHDVRRSGRSLRPRAALPAPRTRRPVAPARQLLSARSRQRHRRGCEPPSQDSRAPHRARRRLSDRAQGSRAARSRQSPRPRAVRIRHTPSGSTCTSACSTRRSSG